MLQAVKSDCPVFCCIWATAVYIRDIPTGKKKVFAIAKSVWILAEVAWFLALVVVAFFNSF